MGHGHEASYEVIHTFLICTLLTPHPAPVEEFPPLRQSSFSQAWMAAIHYVTQLCITPFLYAVTYIKAQFVSTTDESHTGGRACMLMVPLMLVAIISLPFFLVFFPIYVLMCLFKRPFAYRRNGERKVKLVAKSNFTLVTANLCLLKEDQARRHNLRRGFERAQNIGRRIAASEIHRHEELADHHVLTHFPRTDFICWQEVYDQQASDRLLHSLRNYFPHAISDVGDYRWSTNRFLTNSGLMFMSKYPVMACEYYSFKDIAQGDSSCCRGVLMVKVFLVKARTKDKRRTVGFIFNTHLFEQDPHIRNRQMDEIQHETKAFRNRNFDRDHEVVGFQILAGGFGFDNVSQEDHTNFNHHLLTQYEDPCAISPGKDHPWSIGTVLFQPRLHDPTTSSAIDLKKSLLDPVMRAQYVGEQVDLDVSEFEKVPGHRRVDGVYVQRAIMPQLTRHIQSVNLVTAFAGWSDHLPVAITFSVGEHGTDAKIEGLVKPSGGSLSHTPSVMTRQASNSTLEGGAPGNYMSLVNKYGRHNSMSIQAQAQSHARPPMHLDGSTLLRAAPSLSRHTSRQHSGGHDSGRLSRQASSQSDHTNEATNVGAWLKQQGGVITLEEVNMDSETETESEDDDFDTFVDISEV